MRLARGVLSVLLLAGVPAAGADDLPEIKKRGVLRVIVGSDGMPESATLEPGAAPGLERELVEGFAALHRLQIQFVPVPVHTDRFPGLLAGKGDLVVGNVGINEERRNVLAYTRQVFPSRPMAVSWRPHPPVHSLEQLRREKVGTIRNSGWSAWLESARVPTANVDDSFKTAEEVVDALRAGKVTAVVMPVDRALVEKRRNGDLQLGVFLPPSPGRAWALRKESPALLRLLDEYIANIRRSPTWNRLVIKYYGDLALEVLKASATP